MTVLEQELTRFMQSSRGATEEEVNRVRSQMEAKLTRSREDLREAHDLLDKAR
jgi:ElaB/YqjD/DUF883 family membrane-anchored ribosome-binding protein